MRKNNYLHLLMLLLVLLTACEDQIEVKLKDDKKELVIDAVLNNTATQQTIKLTQTIGYFDKINSNPAVTTAQVYMVDENFKIFNFTHDGTGSYNYPTGSDFDMIGSNYALFVVNGTDTFFAIGTMNPAPKIDTLFWKFEKGGSFLGDRYEAEFLANDLPGVGNTYWIRTYKNDSFQNNVDNINIAYDGSFSPGANYDGIEFIIPIRRLGINNFNNPFQLNDKIKVEIYGISNEFYLFLNLAAEQINNGGLFATPPANVPSNFVNQNKQSKARANGFFVIGESNSWSAVIK